MTLFPPTLSILNQPYSTVQAERGIRANEEKWGEAEGHKGIG